MDELRELYQEVILDHNKNPKNFRRLPDATHSASGYNPLCGDRVEVFLDVVDDKINDIAFQGAGCAISKASASLMTTVLRGKSLADAEALIAKFQQLVTAADFDASKYTELGPLIALSGVREYPVRVKCATLAWHTVNAALHGNGKSGETVVKTE